MSMPVHDLDFLDRATDLGEVLRYRAATNPGKRAYAFLGDGVNETSVLSYGELDACARAVAVVLQRRFEPGSRLLMLYPPGLEFSAAFFGCLYAGMIAVPAYPPRKQQADGRILAILKDCGPAGVLTVAATAQALQAMMGTLGAAALPVIATDGIGAEGADEYRDRPLDPGAIAFLQYTSGSTAVPKGVMVTHANIMHNERAIRAAMEHDESVVGVAWLPVFHDMGLLGNMLQPIFAGGTSHLIPPLTFLKRPLCWLEAISKFGGTSCGGPNFAYDLCAQHLAGMDQAPDLDLSSWSLAYVGAEPVRAATLQRFTKACERFGFRKEAFFPCYGLAEVTLIATGGPKSAPPVLRRVAADALTQNRVETRRLPGPGSRQVVGCGQTVEDLEVVIADPGTCHPCPAGHIGEVWVAGGSVAKGYFNNPAETDATFGARLDSGRGPFLRTGDLGFQLDGELFITGRLKDLIVIRGLNYYPNDIEMSAEQAHPGVGAGACAAFAVDAGEQENLVVVAEVARQALHRINAEKEAGDGSGLCADMAARIREQVAQDHELQIHELVLLKPGGIPRTSSGKIRRRDCRALYLAGKLEFLTIV